MTEPGVGTVRPEHVLLPDETEATISPEEIERRRELVRQLRVLPDEALTHLQYLQPQVGCFNRCTFCSQHAGTEVWQFTRVGLRRLLAAIRWLAHERPGVAGRVGMGRQHKPGVLFPYIDNDVGSYEYLDDYVRLVRDSFGGSVRLTTVGFSGGNLRLVEMHRRIATELVDGLAGVRFSITPFTYGWTAAGRAHGTSRRQFRNDLAQAVAAYRPLLDSLGAGKESFAAELRFRPLVVRTAVVDTCVRSRHVVLAGPHLLVAARPGIGKPPVSRVQGISNDLPGRRDLTSAPEPLFSSEGSPYILVTSDVYAAEGIEAFTQRVVEQGRLDEASRREVTLHRLDHPDGAYYTTEPGFARDGSMNMLSIFPASASREGGYNDATRFFLNMLLEHKRAHGRTRRDEFTDATAADVVAVVRRLGALARSLVTIDRRAARHVRKEIIPLVSDYGRVLLSAQLAPRLFFSRTFTIDTGQAVNQGRGRVLFDGLVSREDIPVNPWEERNTHISRSKGYVWRMAPMPYYPSGRPPGDGRRGKKNDPAEVPALIVEEIDPRHVASRDLETAAPLRRYRIYGVETEHLTLRDGHHRYLMPGLLR